MLFDIHGRMIKQQKRLKQRKNYLSMRHIRSGMFMINNKGFMSLGIWKFEIDRKNMFKKKEWINQGEQTIY